MNQREIEKKRGEICRYLPGGVKEAVAAMPDYSFAALQELRLRAGLPIVCHGGNSHYFLTQEGYPTNDVGKALEASAKAVETCFYSLSQNSVYAFLEEIKQGYITIEGGHRVGITGKAVTGGGFVANITNISGLNIRVSNAIKGAANGIFDTIYRNGAVNSTLIISPPGAGKTTLLRDLARLLGDKVKVGIVDERGEIAACVNGRPSHDVGLMTDVLDACPKAVGIPMLLRSMSPEVIITDEIGSSADAHAVCEAATCGVAVITTLHGDNEGDLAAKKELSSAAPLFSCIITLSRRNGAGTIESVTRKGRSVRAC